MKKVTTKQKEGKSGYSERGTGRLYKRSKDGKEYPAGDPHAGNYSLEYRVNGKRTRQRLLDHDGEPITDREEAEKERARITAPFTTSDKADQLQAIKAKLEAAEREHTQAIEEANPPLSIGDAWDAYLNSNDAPETGADTLKYYSGYWTAFRKWIKAKYPETKFLRDITPAMADSYVSKVKRLNYTPNTQNKHTGFLKLLFTTLKEPARLSANPFEKVKKRKLNTQSRRELTIAELRKIIDTSEGELKTLLLIGGATGLRLGDCCTLKWNEIDFDRQQIRRVPNKLRHKGNTAPIKVGIPPELLQGLLRRPASQRRGYVLPEYAELYTYRGKSGRPTKQPQISKRIQAHFERCDIQTHKEGTGRVKVPDPTGKHEYIWESTGKRAVIEVGFHSLRHTYVSLQAERGVPQSTVQAIVGHGSPAMTAHYTHTTDEAARQATLAIGTGVKNAEYEVLPAPLPDWAKELAEKLNSKNWKAIKADLLANT